MMRILQTLGNTPIDTAAISTLFPHNKSIYNKVSALEREGRIIRLKRGQYVVSPQENGKPLSIELIANHIYGPSYVSMESALRFYGLIPEAVFVVRSMTTKHSRTFTNTLGRFEYTECAADYFPIGIRNVSDGDANILIASPEKALSDLIVNTARLQLRSKRDAETFLADYLRFDMDALLRFNADTIELCAAAGKKQTTLHNIAKLIRK